MASIRKDGTVWRVQVAIKGVSECKAFSTKAEAASRAAERETEIRRQVATGIDASKACGDVFDRYTKEVSIHKK